MVNKFSVGVALPKESDFISFKQQWRLSFVICSLVPPDSSLKVFQGASLIALHYFLRYFIILIITTFLYIIIIFFYFSNIFIIITFLFVMNIFIIIILKKTTSRDLLPPRRVESTPFSGSSTQHMWELLAGTAWQFSHGIRGVGVSGVIPDLSARKYNKSKHSFK